MGLSDLTAEILGIPEPSARFLVALYGGTGELLEMRVHVAVRSPAYVPEALYVQYIFICSERNADVYGIRIL